MKAVVFWEVLLKRKYILLISDKLATKDVLSNDKEQQTIV